MWTCQHCGVADKDVERWADGVDYATPEHPTPSQCRAALAAEVGRLRRDAERYRAMRRAFAASAFTTPDGTAIARLPLPARMASKAELESFVGGPVVLWEQKFDLMANDIVRKYPPPPR